MLSRREMLVTPVAMMIAAEASAAGKMSLAIHQNTSAAAGYRASLEGWARAGIKNVEITAAQQHGPEDAHRLDVAGLRGRPLACLLGGLAGFVPVGRLREIRRLLEVGRLRKPPCIQQSCLVPHNVHRRTTRNPGTPGIPRPVRSLQRFVDLPTERQVKHRSPNSPRMSRHFARVARSSALSGVASHTPKARIHELDPGLRLQ